MIDNVTFIVKEHIDNYRQIYKLAIKELEKRYKGSVMGVSWALVRPILFILVYWFAVDLGIRGAGHDKSGVPYIVWLATGIAPWFFITDTLVYGANSIRQTSYLVTKMKFPISIISTYRILSQWFIHLMFTFLVFGITLAMGIKPTWYLLQIPILAVSALLMMIFLSWITSALVVVSRDFEHFVKVLTTVLFWFLPILWDIDRLPAAIRPIMSLNPMAYVIEGYRYSFLGHGWILYKGTYSIYFFTVLIIMGAVGSYIHVKLRPQFADIL